MMGITSMAAIQDLNAAIRATEDWINDLTIRLGWRAICAARSAFACRENRRCQGRHAKAAAQPLAKLRRMCGP